jgi:hypothetical protein
MIRNTLAGLLVTLACALWGAAPRLAAGEQCLALEDFRSEAPGAFPSAWHPRKDRGREIYRVQEEGGKRFLRAQATKEAIQAGLQTPEWDLAQYPVLAWSWRPRAFPPGADERKSNTNDSVLAVYMGVPHSRFGPKAVKYVWSAALPVGTRTESNRGLTQVHVLRSGKPPVPGAWVEERVNVLADWKAAFHESQTPKVAGIGVLTDSDDTESTTAGDYANFRACKY